MLLNRYRVRTQGDRWIVQAWRHGEWVQVAWFYEESSAETYIEELLSEIA